jgi:ATP-binding cassette subfamily C (CFTR/MRP) protein 1
MLLMSTMLALKWPVLTAIFPRICFLAFTLAQPFLLTKAVQFAEGPTTSKTMNSGYGLIGAYALVYIGMAVSDCSDMKIPPFVL